MRYNKHYSDIMNIKLNKINRFKRLTREILKSKFYTYKIKKQAIKNIALQDFSLTDDYKTGLAEFIRTVFFNSDKSIQRFDKNISRYYDNMIKNDHFVEKFEGIV